MKVDAIYSYDVHSESAKVLAAELGVKIINHEGSKFKGLPERTVLNWGCSDLPRPVRACKVLNPENGVRLAVNKLFAFRTLALNEKINLPRWTTDPEAAKKFERKVYCRGKLTGHDGEGITLTEPKAIVPAKLYTEQIDAVGNLKEYRITIFRDKVVARQKKVKVKNFVGGYNDAIKTTNGGYGFDVVDNVPIGVIPQAKLAVVALGLDFGGVDVVHCKDKAYILEVNTAPQLTPYTCKQLCKLIKEFE